MTKPEHEAKSRIVGVYPAMSDEELSRIAGSGDEFSDWPKRHCWRRLRSAA